MPTNRLENMGAARVKKGRELLLTVRFYSANKMMLPRWACYKCGNIGHYAGQLRGAQKMCRVPIDWRTQRFAHPPSAFAITVCEPGDPLSVKFMGWCRASRQATRYWCTLALLALDLSNSRTPQDMSLTLVLALAPMKVSSPWRLESGPTLTDLLSQTMLSLPGLRPRPSRLSYPTSDQWYGQWPLLHLQPARPSCRRYIMFPMSSTGPNMIQFLPEKLSHSHFARSQSV